MSRRISLYLLLTTVVLIGVLFYQVIQPFVISLLFAIVLAVLFRPAYVWLTAKMGGREEWAAMVTTLAVLLLLLIPLGCALAIAGSQLVGLSKSVSEILVVENDGENMPKRLEEKIEQTPWAAKMKGYYDQLSPGSRDRVKNVTTRVADGFVRRVYEKTFDLIGDLVNFLVGLVVTGMALYYSLVDGDNLVRQAKDFIPLEEEEEDELIVQFGKVCRGVVLGTVVAAFAQSVLAGIAFAVAGVPNVFLLMAVTMFFAFIPFIGAGSVVVTVAGWLALQGEYVTAGILLLYSAGIVSVSDNLIRAYIIGTEAKMNPLIAFITVLGAIQLIGLMGIFVGPMIAALFYTLIKLLRERIVVEDLTQQPSI